MPIPVSLKSSKPYVMKADRNTANPPEFMIGAVRAGDMAEMADRASKMDENASIQDQAKLAREAIVLGLRGWRGWYFDEARTLEVPYDSRDGRPTPETIDLLDLGAQVELMTAIFDVNRVSRDDEKN